MNYAMALMHLPRSHVRCPSARTLFRSKCTFFTRISTCVLRSQITSGPFVDHSNRLCVYPPFVFPRLSILRRRSIQNKGVSGWTIWRIPRGRSASPKAALMMKQSWQVLANVKCEVTDDQKHSHTYFSPPHTCILSEYLIADIQNRCHQESNHCHRHLLCLLRII